MRLIIFHSQASLHTISLQPINPINHTNSDNGNGLAPSMPHCKILLPCLDGNHPGSHFEHTECTRCHLTMLDRHKLLNFPPTYSYQQCIILGVKVFVDIHGSKELLQVLFNSLYGIIKLTALQISFEVNSQGSQELKN